MASGIGQPESKLGTTARHDFAGFDVAEDESKKDSSVASACDSKTTSGKSERLRYPPRPVALIVNDTDRRKELTLSTPAASIESRIRSTT